MKAVLGEDFSVEGNQVAFEVDEQFDSFQLRLSVENGQIMAISAIKLPE
jgi:hypothetical protein